jgi:hypothetical protein
MSKRAKRQRRDKALPKDYDHLRVQGASLITPDGVFPMKRIGYGLFSDAYKLRDLPDTVVAVSAKNVRDKEIAEAAKEALPKNPHIPAVTTLGHTAREDVYVMPLYRAPLDGDRYKRADRDAGKLNLCRFGAMLDADTPRQHRDYVLQCAEEERVSKSVLEALRTMREQADKISDGYLFEFPDRNLATDERGNLVLLDVLYDANQITAQKARGR